MDEFNQPDRGYAANRHTMAFQPNWNSDAEML